MDYRHHHQLQEDLQVDLEVLGRHALLFDDDTTSSFINSSDALVPWSGGDASLLIDRYDARHLLQRLPLPRALRNQQSQREEVAPEPDGVSKTELDFERYQDIRSSGVEEYQEGTRQNEEMSSSSYRSVPFSYDTLGNLKTHDAGFKSSYRPPFPMPEHLLYNLPPTEKVHQIISRTAKFVSEHGGQSEIILRVKQGGNPTFGFLMPDHELHAYFRFLVDHPEVHGINDSTDGEGKKRSSNVENELPVTSGALSLLGSIYGTAEDDCGIQDDANLKGTQDKNADVSCTMSIYKQKEASSSISKDNKSATKQLMVASERLSVKKSHSLVLKTTGHGQNKTKEASVPSNLFMKRPEANMLDPGTLIVEPPSSLKRMVDKTVEFILKNGKEFEASLIEQDKKNDKFPFLRPSSMYHSYYLKALQNAHESKMPRKGHSDYRSLSGQHVRSISDESLSDSRNVVNEFEAPYQFDRKEKFRMVIGGAKKDSGNSSSKPAKPPGLTAEETAAVVMAATRGLSNKSTSDTMRKRSVDDLDTVSKVAGNSHSSSLGSFPPMPGKHSISKAVSDGKAGNFLPDGFSRDAGKHGKESINASSGVLVANAIAKTVAGEADSSDACLSKEQKLKAERLKRARMFAALVKRGKHKSTELSPTLVGHGGSELAAGSSVFSGQDLDLSRRERECSSVPDVAETSDDSGGKGRGYDSKRANPTEKDETNRSHYVEHSMEKKNSRRKPHHSTHSSHSGGHVHKHKRHRSHRRKDFDSSDGDHEDSDSSGDKQKMKHQPPNRKHSVDYEPKTSSRSRHRHEPSRSDDDENQERRHKKSRREESQNLRNKGSSVTSSVAKQASPQLRGDIREVAQPLVSGASSSPATEVPDDLRAKIRAMLLETL